jgi:hypothetical protein
MALITFYAPQKGKHLLADGILVAEGETRFIELARFTAEHIDRSVPIEV